jgi:hypothetical protein
MKKVCALLLLIFLSPVFATGISGTSAPCDNATLSKYTGTANIEINWEPNTIGLKWYNGDQQVAGPTSCVYDSTITVPPQPTKLGYTFNGWKVWKVTVPDGYTQLEYIQSDGEQRIDTGIYANENTAVETKFINIDIPDSTTRIIIADRWKHIDYGNYYTGYELTITGYTRSFQTIGTLWITRNDYWAEGIEYTVYMDKNVGQTVNGVTTVWSGTANTFTTPRTLSMFGTTDDTSRYAKIKMFYLKIWQSGELIRNFLPAKRNSDNVLGMFDTVSGQFFTNAGTGSFVAGPVAQ